MRQIKLTELEMYTMAEAISGFMTGHLRFCKEGEYDDARGIAGEIDQVVARFRLGQPTLKDLCIAKLARSLPYTHFESEYDLKWWKAQIIAWEKLHAYSVHDRICRSINFLKKLVACIDEEILQSFLDFELRPTFDEVIKQTTSVHMIELSNLMRDGDGK